MARLSILLFLVNLVVVVIALIDCLSTDQDEIRSLPKIAWVFIILLFSPVGAIVWFMAGRPRPAVAGGGRRGPTQKRQPGGGRSRPSRPLAPDDDPAFLEGLAERNRQQDEEMFTKWEADLRRREEELRKREQDDEEGPEKDGEGRPPRG